MSLEDEVFRIEERAAGILSNARAEAKRILSSAEDEQRRIRQEIASRVEEEKAGIKREFEGVQAAEVAEIRRAGGIAVRKLEKAGSEKASRIAKLLLVEITGG